jgi:hypothetical protein
MMNHFFEQLKKEAHTIRLSAAEKQAMRVRLYKAMRASPVISSAPHTPAPLRPTPSPYVWFSPRMAVPFAAFLVVVLGSGTAFAAQGALPGSPLYAVKVHITEPTLGALALTPQAKAQWNAQVAQTRLEEAETLASTGSLDATTSEELASNFDTHAQAAQNITANLQTQDPATAAQISAEFDSSLQAHDAILTQLGDESGSSTTKTDSSSLVLDVRSHERGDNTSNTGDTSGKGDVGQKTRTFTALNTQSAMSTLGASTTSGTSTPPAVTPNTINKGQKSVATRLETKANDALTQTQNDYATIQPNLSSSTISLVDARIASIEAVLNAGTASMSSSDYSGATKSFTQALSLALQLDAFISAGEKFDKQLLPSLLNNSGGNTDNSGKGGKDSGEKNIQTQTVASTTQTIYTNDNTSGNNTSSDTNNGGGDNGGDAGAGDSSNQSHGGSFHFKLNL